MIRLADFCYRRRRLVLLGWVVGLVVVIALGQALPAKHRAEYRTPGAEATKAYDLLGERFPARKGDSIKIVFAGNLQDPATKSAVQAVIDKAAKVAPRERSRQPLRPRERFADFQRRQYRLRTSELRRDFETSSTPTPNSRSTFSTPFTPDKPRDSTSKSRRSSPSKKSALRPSG